MFSCKMDFLLFFIIATKITGDLGENMFDQRHQINTYCRKHKTAPWCQLWFFKCRRQVFGSHKILSQISWIRELLLVKILAWANMWERKTQPPNSHIAQLKKKYTFSKTFVNIDNQRIYTWMEETESYGKWFHVLSAQLFLEILLASPDFRRNESERINKRNNSGVNKGSVQNKCVVLLFFGRRTWASRSVLTGVWNDSNLWIHHIVSVWPLTHKVIVPAGVILTTYEHIP